ncbi:hypothetical protein K474DRAFT_1679837 [Panus rudis PR-1116 ss-1]|nr:hypothetical protein K474DRAFT_1679837 [Panus rudis PR-1116 ss-1]
MPSNSHSSQHNDAFPDPDPDPDAPPLLTAQQKAAITKRKRRAEQQREEERLANSTLRWTRGRKDNTSDIDDDPPPPPKRTRKQSRSEDDAEDTAPPQRGRKHRRSLDSDVEGSPHPSKHSRSVVQDPSRSPPPPAGKKHKPAPRRFYDEDDEDGPSVANAEIQVGDANGDPLRQPSRPRSATPESPSDIDDAKSDGANDPEDQDTHSEAGSDDDDNDLVSLTHNPAALKAAMEAELPRNLADQEPPQSEAHRVHRAAPSREAYRDVANSDEEQDSTSHRRHETGAGMQPSQARRQRQRNPSQITSTSQVSVGSKQPAARGGRRAAAMVAERPTSGAPAPLVTQDELPPDQQAVVRALRRSSNRHQGEPNVAWPAEILINHSRRGTVPLSSQTVLVQTFSQAYIREYLKDMFFRSDFLKAQHKLIRAYELLLECTNILELETKDSMYKWIRKWLRAVPLYARDFIDVVTPLDLSHGDALERERELRKDIKKRYTQPLIFNEYHVVIGDTQDFAVLANDLMYIYPGNPKTGAFSTAQPFYRPIFSKVLHHAFFDGVNSFAVQHPDAFLSEQYKCKIIPLGMLAFVTACIFMALHETVYPNQHDNDKNTKAWASSWSNEYELAWGYLNNLRQQSPDKYTALMNKLYNDANNDIDFESRHEKVVRSFAKLDLDNMPGLVSS